MGRRGAEVAAMPQGHRREAQIVGERTSELKRVVHPEVGDPHLTCQTLLDLETGHSLLV